MKWVRFLVSTNLVFSTTCLSLATCQMPCLLVWNFKWFFITYNFISYPFSWSKIQCKGIQSLSGYGLFVSVGFWMSHGNIVTTIGICIWLGFVDVLVFYTFRGTHFVEDTTGHNWLTRANERSKDQNNRTIGKTERHKILTWKTMRGKNHGSPQTPKESLYE